MTEVRVFCDRCGAHVTEGRVHLENRLGPSRLARPEVDLCPDCAAAFWAWLDSRPDGSPAPRPRPAPRPGRPTLQPA